MMVLSKKPPTDPAQVLQDTVREWHFHIYFLQQNEEQATAALALRDAVLRLRRHGVFVAVPLWRVNTSPIGPHPVGSYEIWVPKESFADVYSYLALNRGELSILIHPLTKQERLDHSHRNSWMGPSFPLNLDVLPVESDSVPLQYPSLQLGYSSKEKDISLEERDSRGAALEEKLKGEEEAAPAPKD
ncbi:hypothetical protein T439DRAFT_326719 [Meredithblackwellia eburnea MCA 4105]